MPNSNGDPARAAKIILDVVRGRMASHHPRTTLGWVATLLPPLVEHAAENLTELSAAQAADVVVDTLLRGVGTPPTR